MINTNKLAQGILNLIGWKDYFDANEIPATGIDQNPESGEYFNTDYLPFDLDIIKASIPTTRDLTEYLQTQTKAGAVYLANKLKNHKLIKQASRGVLQNFTIFPNGGVGGRTIQKRSRFVGIQFELKHDVGLQLVLNRFGIQLSQVNTDLTIYLFHTSQVDPITTFDISTVTPLSWKWEDKRIELFADDANLTGGTFYLGYYEDDLIGNALNFNKAYFGFDRGWCTTCGHGDRAKKYKTLSQYATVTGFYVSSGDFVQGETIDPRKVKETCDNNYGINLNLTVACDLTNYLIDNRFQLTTAYGNAVAFQVMKSIEYTQQNNAITDDIIGSIQVDMNGTTDAVVDTIGKRIEESIQAVTLDQSDLSSVCFPCYKPGGVNYGAI